MSIKRGVNFYSYQDRQFRGEFGLEECMRAASEAGATGIGLMPQQTRIGHFPNYTDAEIDRWFYLLDKYQLEPIEFLGFVDSPRRGQKDLPLEDLVEQTIREIKLCQRFKAPMLNVGLGTHQLRELINATAPVAQEHDVKLGITCGFYSSFFEGGELEYYVDLIERTNNKHLGFVLDFNLFSQRLSPSLVAQLLRNGADRDAVDYILKSFDEGMNRAEIAGNVTLMGGSDRFSRFLSEITYLPGYYSVRYTRPERALAGFFGPCGAGVNDYSPEFIRDVSKYIFLCQGKAYDMTEDGLELNIDYENPIRVLKESNWDGYITTHYEGQRNFHDAKSETSADEVEVVRLHQDMLQRLIDRPLAEGIVDSSEVLRRHKEAMQLATAR